MYCNWQQNKRIPTFACRVVALLRKDPNIEDVIEHVRTITQFNASLKILSKVLSKRLALIVDMLIGREQVCAIPTRIIHYNLYLVRNIIVRAGNEYGMNRSLMNFDQSKAFDTVDQQYLVAVIRAAVFGPVICLRDVANEVL